MKKNLITINNEKFETIISNFYQGNKEEISIKKQIIFLWLTETSFFEYWLKIEVDNKDEFELYLKNNFNLLNLIKKSKLLLLKRNYKEYDIFEEVKEYDTFDKINKSFLLPTKEATIGYDLLTKLQTV